MKLYIHYGFISFFVYFCGLVYFAHFWQEVFLLFYMKFLRKYQCHYIIAFVTTIFDSLSCIFTLLCYFNIQKFYILFKSRILSFLISDYIVMFGKVFSTLNSRKKNYLCFHGFSVLFCFPFKSLVHLEDSFSVGRCMNSLSIKLRFQDDCCFYRGLLKLLESKFSL